MPGKYIFFRKFVEIIAINAHIYALLKNYWRIINMTNDPIVNEVRKIRLENAKKFKFDIRALVEDARQREKKTSRKIVSFCLDLVDKPHNKKIQPAGSARG
jgi:hypothetical protein